MAPRRIVKMEPVSLLNPPKTIKKDKISPVTSPFACPICGDVWQPLIGNNGKVILHDFPKIGCTPNICLKCR